MDNTKEIPVGEWIEARYNGSLVQGRVTHAAVSLMDPSLVVYQIRLTSSVVLKGRHGGTRYEGDYLSIYSDEVVRIL